MTSAVVTDETAIRDLVAGTSANLKAGDVQRLLARFTPDAVQYSLAPPLSHTAPQVHDADGLAAWFGTFAGPVDHEVTDLAVFVGGDVAYAHGIARLSATPVGMTEPFTLWFRLTIGLQRTAEGWQVEHEHQSVPFEMDGSFRASVELTP